MNEKIQVLYVDDEPGLLHLGKIFLERPGLISVTTSESALDALLVLQKKPFDAIISDYQMPGMDGLDLLSKVRLEHGEMPFILFTGKGREEVVIHALNRGADFYLQKGGDPKSQFAELTHKILQAVRKREIEAALRESEEKFRVLANTSPVAIVVFQGDRDVYVNDYTTFLTGYSKEELCSMNFWDLIHPDFRENIKDLGLTRLQERKDPMRHEIQYLTITGESRWADLSAGNILYEGYPAGIAMLVDITERKRAERAICESESQYKAFFENSGAPTIIIGPDMTILHANTAWERLSLFPREEQENILKWTDFSDPSDTEFMKRNHDERRKNPSLVPRTYECTVIDKEKHRHYCIANVDMIPGSQNSVASLIDLTDRRRAERELRESEEKFKALVQESLEGVVIADLSGNLLFANQSAKRIFRFPPDDDPAGRVNVLDFFSPECRSEVIADLDTVASGKDGYLVRYKALTLETQEIWIECVGKKIIFDETPSILLSIRDYSERRLIEEALQKSEAIFRLLEEQLPDFVILHDGETISFVNAETLRQIGKSREEVIGTSLLSYVSPEYHELVRENIRLRHTGVLIDPYDIVVQGPSGIRQWVTVRATPVPDQPKPTMLTVLTDISSRKKAEDALKESETKYRSIIENMQDLFYRTDLDGKITMVSPLGIRLAGFRSPEDVIGLNAATEMYADPKEREQFLALLSEKGEVRDFPLSLRGYDGAPYYVTASSHFIYDQQGKKVGIEGILHDITEQKRIKDSLIQANRKLNLLSSITRHDINNQLTGMSGYLDILEDGITEPKFREYFKKVQESVRHISSMIQFTEDYESVGVSTPSWHNSRTLVDSVAESFPGGYISLVNDLPQALWIYADPLMVKVIYNLVDNAIRYSGIKPTLHFYVSYPGEEAIIVCEDNGQGIPYTEKESIFDRGYGNNTGLGLALSREILLITGVTIRETGEPKKGARFEMIFPKGIWMNSAPLI